jgi:hypothetical protein
MSEIWSKTYIELNVKCTLFLSDFKKPNFLDRSSTNNIISNFINICPVGAELFYADRRTDRQTGMTKLIDAFRNFANATKNEPSDSLNMRIIFVAQQPNSGLSRLIVEVPRSHTIRHTHTHTQQDSFERGSARRRHYDLHTQDTNTHSLSGIQTRDSSNPAAADPHLRQQGRRNRRISWLAEQILLSKYEPGYIKLVWHGFTIKNKLSIRWIMI